MVQHEANATGIIVGQLTRPDTRTSGRAARPVRA